jgi:hypothetical protein
VYFTAVAEKSPIEKWEWWKPAAASGVSCFQESALGRACHGHQTAIVCAGMASERRNPTDARDGNYNNLHVGLVRPASRFFVSRFLLSNHLARLGGPEASRRRLLIEAVLFPSLGREIQKLAWNQRGPSCRANRFRIGRATTHWSPAEKRFSYHLQRAAPHR